MGGWTNAKEIIAIIKSANSEKAYIIYNLYICAVKTKTKQKKKHILSLFNNEMKLFFFFFYRADQILRQDVTGIVQL